MRCLSYILSLAFVVVALVSCSNAGRNVEVHDVDGCMWSGAEEFAYSNTDSLSKRDISIVVRYGKGYVADSVALRILSISPDSMVFEEPFTLYIPRVAEVRPQEQTFAYRRNVVLGTKGEYRFRLTPQHPVEGISSVGIVIDGNE